MYGHYPNQGLVVANNVLYHTPALNPGNNIRSGYGENTNLDVTIYGNYSAAGSIEVVYHTSVIFMNNIQIPFGGAYTHFIPETNAVSSYTWDSNTYSTTNTTKGFSYNAAYYSFANWKTASGFDANSTFTSGSPTGVVVFVQPNLYESNRANIAVFNWAANDSVNVDVSSALAVGTSYEVRNVQDYFARQLPGELIPVAQFLCR